MGGGPTTTPPTVTQVPNPTNVPLQEPLIGTSTRQINQAAPYSYYGSGNQLLPTANLGQVYMGGPNPTMYGNPTSTAAGAASFGQVGNYNAPNAAQAGGGQNSGAGYGSLMQSLSGIFGGLSQGQQSQLGQVAQNYLGGQGGSPGPSGSGGSSAGQAGQGAPPSSPAAPPAQGAKPIGGPPGGPPPNGSQQAQGGGSFTTTGSGASTNPTISPGQVEPNSQPGDSPLLPPQPGATDAVRNSFLPSSETAPFYNQAAVAGNLGTAAGQAVQPAANFMSSLFGPGLSDMSQAYLGAGAANAGTNLRQGISQLQQQYEHDPFNDALGRSEANLISQTANNTLQTAAGMGVQQQQIAANQMSTPFNLTAQNAATGVQDAQGLFNMSNTAYTAPYSLPMQTYSQVPISAPVVTPGTQSSPKLF